MMREVDTISPVVWPSWCYSVEGHNESEVVEKKEGQAHLTGGKPRAKRRSHALMAVRYQRGDTNGDLKGAEAGKGDEKGDADIRKDGVKSERLSPAGPVSLLDQNSNSSRSGTPSNSYPSTPPEPPSHLKQMEQMMLARNYSDFMRSLAAKYNNANPNDYFSNSRNGFPANLDPRFSAFKSAATPFVGLMAPLAASASAVSPASQPPTTAPSPSEILKPKTSELFGTNGINPFFPPMIDMTSTQALLNMVRTAGAQNPDGYFKSSSQKRANESSPLDLSSGALVSKKMKRESVYSADSFLPLMDVIRTKGKSLKKSGGSRLSPVSSLNAENRNCTEGDHQAIAHWTVDDVCSFVTSIDVCAEYEKNFRDERIDGSALPLLTEEHLTNSLGMKLGPALNLRSSLARRLGNCSICLHCVHCHTPTAGTPTPAATPQPVPATNSRPSSAGN